MPFNLAHILAKSSKPIITSIPAKPAFGTLKENGFQSDYIANKKAKLIYCKERLYCDKLLRASSYDQKSLFNRGLNIKNLGNCTLLPFNKSNLIVNLYSKEDLVDVCTVIKGYPCDQINECTACDTPCTIDADLTEPFNFNYTIDPQGTLFGNTPCGVNNFVHYMEFTPSII